MPSQWIQDTKGTLPGLYVIAPVQKYVWVCKLYAYMKKK